ncbi:restriction endonuclease subunit S [Staphylococcus equorum]|uniref:restriction endonuclease subunit S n=1 Tax=Staphylococcus TaxID=1279 RepID=UPI000E068DEE|nr:MULTISPECIES: restriction endonuclease subunit S [Staphylococcus]QPS99503.1 restriction endonuclease subunit S [Staphylococcus equorum]SUM85632.1 Type I restriction-modification system,specificity subunit S [Staphylococcus saprophyticus]
MEFKEVKLGEISNINMGQSPRSEFYSEFEGTPFLQGNRTFQHIYPLIDTYTNKITKLANKNDILFSVRAPVGDMNIAPVDLCIGRGLCAINSTNSNQEFLFYLLKSKLNELESHSTGTIFSSVNKKTLENFIVKVPSDSHQKNIGRLLSNLDKKIEINQNIIANLEELSQTLFKRWFVDFEFPDENGNPYKSSGGEMIDSELGEIPDGWNVKNLKDIAFCQNGYAFYKLGYSNSGYFAVDLGNININSQFVYTNKDKFISKDIIDEKKEKFILNKNDLVMVMTDRTQEMNILGRTARIPKSNKYVLNQRIFRLRAKNKHILTYLQAMLNSVEIRNQLKMKSLGSAQKYINTKHITELSIKCPDNELIKNFYRSCENYFIKSEMLNEEIEKLTQLRDTLLPKLMSGEIEIPDDIEVNEDELSI